mgnify:CR=1 FL=1
MEPIYSFTRQELVSIFGEWSIEDVKVDRNGKVDAQTQTDRFLDTSRQLFNTESPSETKVEK